MSFSSSSSLSSSSSPLFDKYRQNGGNRRRSSVKFPRTGRSQSHSQQEQSPPLPPLLAVRATHSNLEFLRRLGNLYQLHQQLTFALIWPPPNYQQVIPALRRSIEETQRSLLMETHDPEHQVLVNTYGLEALSEESLQILTLHMSTMYCQLMMASVSPIETTLQQ